ncbi:MAG TPA: UDP-glucose/GDP-mannose dehydrogenase family protein [Methanospirillum sp.]|nr:UDP-glucose/GDP-mannose dehydrogenase family protein [Methanospirillum sp.]
MQISIIGGGYVGLVTGACIASMGHSVVIIDLDPDKIAAINRREPPIFEVGLTEILTKYVGKTLNGSTDYSSISSSDLIFICVGTPEKQDGSADLSYIQAAASHIGESFRGKTRYQVVAVKSTVPPGTTKEIVKSVVLASSGRTDSTIGFVMNPEFLREGRAIQDFLNPDRIVIGTDSDEAYQVLESLYNPFHGPKIRTSLTAAEMIKYTSNAFLATKISFSNEIGNICKNLDLDVYEVMAAVGLDSRIGPNFLNAGAGFGGSCFPKDVQALMHLAQNTGIDPLILKAILRINEEQPRRMVELLRKRCGNLLGKRITILGLAFKDNTDDIRESRSIPVIQMLQDAGAEIVAYDPMAMGNMARIFPTIEYSPTSAEALTNSEGALVMTEWPQFREIEPEFSLMRTRIVIDGRHLVSGPGIEGVCW